MSKHIHLSIADPCHENWDSMTPADKGKFCGSCQKQVIDFSYMNDREITQFFKKPSTGSVCGRFMEDQLNRTIAIPRKRIPWVKYFFQFALPAFLVSLKASAQKERPLMGKISSVCVRPLMGDTVMVHIQEQNTGSANIAGKIIGGDGKPVLNVSVVIKGKHIGMVTDLNGNFSIKAETNWDKVILVASCVGYETTEVEVLRKNYPDTININIGMIQVKYQLMGEVVITKRHTKKAVNPIPLIPDAPKDIRFKNFKVYPNPAKSGSELHIQWKKNEIGNYILTLLNQSGQLIFTKEMWVDKEARLLEVPIPEVVPGAYFLQMTNSESGKTYTEKIIIQAD